MSNMIGPERAEVFANPGIQEVLRAAPWLMWRRCPGCEAVSLYNITTIPMFCRSCGDCTDDIPEANDILHRRLKGDT